MAIIIIREEMGNYRKLPMASDYRLHVDFEKCNNKFILLCTIKKGMLPKNPVAYTFMPYTFHLPYEKKVHK